MRILFYFFLCYCHIVLALSDPTEGITYVTEEYPPYNFHDNKGPHITGLSVDILLEMFRIMGSNKTDADIQIKLWHEGYQAAQEPNKMIVLFSTTRTDAREHLFKWVGPIINDENSIFVLASNPGNVKISSDADYKKYTFTAIYNDIGHLILKDLGVPDDNILTANKFEQMLNLLKTQKVHAISYNGVVSMWLIKSSGGAPKDYLIIKSTNVGAEYFAFNKSIPDNIVNIHQSALNEVKNNQYFMKTLMKKYSK